MNLLEMFSGKRSIGAASAFLTQEESMTKAINVEIVDPMTAEQELNLINYKRALNRRRFMSNLGMAGLATAGATILAGCGGSSSATPTTPTMMAAGPSEADVLTFALNLEYLEASFYLYATTGSGLAAANTGSSPGAVTGGAKVTFTDQRTADIAAQIAQDEMEHVIFLRSGLTAAGVTPASMPAINLGALGIGFASQAQFLTLARAFEDTGVSAYAGAATLLTSTNLQYAAQILATEAYHSGNIRLNCVTQGVVCPPTDSMDIPPTETTFFALDSNGLALMRTPSQVLQIVFATTSTGVTKGGFYPNGINTTSATGISST